MRIRCRPANEQSSACWTLDPRITQHSNPLSPVHIGSKVEFNTVDFVESRLLPKPAANQQQSRLSPYPVDFVAGFGNKSVTSTACRGRHCRQFGRLCRPNVERPFELVASVYGVKAQGRLRTLSTFHKVDRVEFNLVASV